jgi:hypothetical protein
MRGSLNVRVRVLTAAVVVAAVSAAVLAQAPKAANSNALPRTPDGRPDLQGVFDYATATPLERPAAFAGKAVLTEAEVAAFLQQQAANRSRIDDAPAAGSVGGYNQFWYEFGTNVVPDRRTSLITDPPDGKMPPLTPLGQQRAADHRARLRRLAEGPEDRDSSERCLLGYNAGPPMIGVGYNQHAEIVQTPGYFLIHTEMVHTARVVPLDGRPFLANGLNMWSGNSRGRWEGDTLVVETKGFVDQTWNQFGGWNWAADENLHVVEKFSLGNANTIRYEFTVTDPTIWTKPWTGVSALRRTDEQMFEYACHEGNYGMQGILGGARAEERRGAATKD